MNWDWDKLQENRKRQSSEPPSNRRNDEPEGNGFGNYNNQLKGILSGLPVPLFVLAGLLWLGSGIFIVNPGEQGVVLRFGKLNRTVSTGPHYRLPFPLESNIIQNTDSLQMIEVGVAEKNVQTAPQQSVLQSTMYTADGNMIHVHFNVQYTIIDAAQYLFKVQNPTSLIENAAEAAMSEVIGQKSIESISGLEHQVIEKLVLEIITRFLDTYDMGVKIHAVQLGEVYPPQEVKGAFVAVDSAKKAKVTIENNAKAYRAEIVPVASGSAKSIVNAARSYSETIVKEAEGEAARFTMVAEEFAKSKEITKTRLYLEMMEEVLASPDMEKLIISTGARGAVVPHLNLNEPFATRKTASLPSPLQQKDSQGQSVVSSSSETAAAADGLVVAKDSKETRAEMKQAAPQGGTNSTNASPRRTKFPFFSQGNK